MTREEVETLYQDVTTRFGLTTRYRLEVMRAEAETCDTLLPPSEEVGDRSISGMLARQNASTCPAPTCEIVPPSYDFVKGAA